MSQLKEANVELGKEVLQKQTQLSKTEALLHEKTEQYKFLLKEYT